MTDTAEPLPIAKGTHTVFMLPGMANRNGLQFQKNVLLNFIMRGDPAGTGCIKK
jgi:hypothetical protein